MLALRWTKAEVDSLIFFMLFLHFLYAYSYLSFSIYVHIKYLQVSLCFFVSHLATPLYSYPLSSPVVYPFIRFLSAVILYYYFCFFFLFFTLLDFFRIFFFLANDTWYLTHQLWYVEHSSFPPALCVFRKFITLTS